MACVRLEAVGVLTVSGALCQVKPELATVSKTDAPTESFARCNYDVSCEQAMNEQVGAHLHSSSLMYCLGLATATTFAIYIVASEHPSTSL